ncbi:MAG: glycosyltransferase family 4 protein [Deltaproteobacteria bacterium]|nr:glycosyltransferase family 4 protein [Deltaproteobacteria bacterium]
MKICFYADTFFPLVGGAEMVLHNLANQLTQRGEETHILAPRVRGADNKGPFPYQVHRFGKPYSKRFLVRQTLIHLLWLQLRYRFDLLHCHAGYPPGYVGATFKKWFDTPLVVRPHGSDIVPGERIRKNPRLEKRLRQALVSADAVVAQGQYLKDVIVDLGVEEKKIHIIHNGVNLEIFSKGEAFAYPRPYIVSLGNLIPRKGFDILLHAYARLRGRKPDLIVAGPGPEKDRLQWLARDLGIAEQVRFPGFIGGQDKINLLCSAEFFVCPSRKEPFANVILEALAAGLPVVASAVDGNTELVHHGKQGLLFPSEDIAALEKSLQSMIHQPGLAHRLRSAVPEFAKQFDWPIVAGRYHTLYDSLKRHRSISLPPSRGRTS